MTKMIEGHPTMADLEDQVAAANAKVVNLEQALESSRRIGAAIGVLMALQHVTETEAFALLRQASQNRNCKLRILADEVVLTGEMRGRRRPGSEPVEPAPIPRRLARGRTTLSQTHHGYSVIDQ